MQLWSPSRTIILLLYRERSVKFTNLSRPSIYLMLLKERSNHLRFVRCPIFYTFSIMLLSSWSFYKRVKDYRYCTFQMSWLKKISTKKWKWEDFNFAEINIFSWNDFILIQIIFDGFSWNNIKWYVSMISSMTVASITFFSYLFRFLDMRFK